MRSNRIFRCVPLFLAVALPASAADTAAPAPTATVGGAKPSLSVAKTEASSVASWQPAMGEGLAQMLITELTKLQNFTVLESVALDDLRAERALGESGEVNQSQSVKKGGWLGADYTFKSTVTRFGSKEQNYGSGGGVPVPFVGGFGFSVKKSENEVQIDWRIIDNNSRQVIKADRSVGIEKGSGFNFNSWHGGGFNNSREFMDSALGKATMKALADIVTKVSVLQVAPGTRAQQAEAEQAAGAAAMRNIKGVVKMVEGKEIWVSLGSNNGFAKGDKVKIYKPVEKKNKKGEVIATTYESVGEIILIKVQKDKSMGEYAGATQISEDWAAADSAVDIEKIE
jgi:curli biogenesis system outer membrane secretion channel CsgG